MKWAKKMWRNCSKKTFTIIKSWHDTSFENGTSCVSRKIMMNGTSVELKVCHPINDQDIVFERQSLVENETTAMNRHKNWNVIPDLHKVRVRKMAVVLFRWSKYKFCSRAAAQFIVKYPCLEVYGANICTWDQLASLSDRGWLVKLSDTCKLSWQKMMMDNDWHRSIITNEEKWSKQNLVGHHASNWNCWSIYHSHILSVLSQWRPRYTVFPIRLSHMDESDNVMFCCVHTWQIVPVLNPAW